MFIFSNISSSTGAYGVFAKDPLDIHSSIDYHYDNNSNMSNNNNNNKIISI